MDVNSAWISTCKVLLGVDPGSLADYGAWLSEHLEPYTKRKSCISGKEVFAVGDYPASAKFESLDELGKLKKPPPLNINQIKDIDSILEAVREQAVYAGNIVLGNSSFVENSTGMEDSHCVDQSHTMHTCESMAYCTVGRVDKFIFGCAGTGETTYSIKAMNNWRNTRCLNTSYAYESSDIYYSHQIFGCMDCLFCFNLRAKRRMIGNISLEAGKFAQLKKKLIGELAAELVKRKRLPSLLETASSKEGAKNIAHIEPAKQEKTDMASIDSSFGKTCELVLGKNIGGLKEFGSYLSKHTQYVLKGKSCASGKDIFASGLSFDRAILGSAKAVALEELGHLCHEMKMGASFDASLKSMPALIAPVAYFCADQQQQSTNIIECTHYQSSSDSYRSSRVFFTKSCAYCFWPRDCERVFGCQSLRNSSFCIKCYNSFKLARCFEVDTSQNCTGSYFLHNCENVHDSMFCFNAKNLRYAVANTEVGRERFLQLKAAVLGEIAEKLEKEKTIEISIYSLGNGKKQPKGG